MINLHSGFQWFGDKLKAQVNQAIDNRMDRAGKAMVARARELVPVRSGYLRDSIGYTYRQSDKTLQVHADAPYAFWVEYGTRLMSAKPFLRPAMIEVGKAWGGSTELQFGPVNSANTLPLHVENKAAVRFNEATNRRLDRKSGHKVIFHGHKLSKRRFYQPAHEVRHAPG